MDFKLPPAEQVYYEVWKTYFTMMVEKFTDLLVQFLFVQIFREILALTVLAFSMTSYAKLNLEAIVSLWLVMVQKMDKIITY